MKIVFISNCFESLGIEYLSAALKKAGHEVSLLLDPCLFDDQMIVNAPLAAVFDERKRLVRNVVRSEPDLVCISVVTDVFLWAEGLAKEIKRLRDVPVAFGGIHPTSVPDVVIKSPYVDYLVQGEGDEAIVELVSRLEKREDVHDVPNVWSKGGDDYWSNPPRPLIENLDNLPFPDKSVYDSTYLKDQAVYTIMASRGCPYKCTYCNASLIKDIYSGEKRYQRLRSPGNVIEELKQAKSRRRMEYVSFFDEIFGTDIRWLREFAPLYKKEISLPFLAITHPSHCSEEYVALVKEAGCVKLDLGVQSTDPEIRKDVLHRNETNEQVANAIDRIMKAGIFLLVENIFNLPGQTEEKTLDMARFYNRHRPNGIKVFGLRIFPRTPIEDIALERGLITKQFVEDNARGIVASKEVGFLGGTVKDRSLFRFQTLFAVLPFLSPKTVDEILDKGYYKYLPTFRNATLLSRFISSRGFEHDVMSRIMKARYRHHITGTVLNIFGR